MYKCLTVAELKRLCVNLGIKCDALRYKREYVRALEKYDPINHDMDVGDHNDNQRGTSTAKVESIGFMYKVNDVGQPAQAVYVNDWTDDPAGTKGDTVAMLQFQLKLAREKRQVYERLRKAREQELLELKRAREREAQRGTRRADNNRLFDELSSKYTSSDVGTRMGPIRNNDMFGTQNATRMFGRAVNNGPRYTGRQDAGIKAIKTPLVNVGRGQANYAKQGGGFCNANGKRRPDDRNGSNRLQTRKACTEGRDLMYDKRTSNCCSSVYDDNNPETLYARRLCILPRLLRCCAPPLANLLPASSP